MKVEELEEGMKIKWNNRRETATVTATGTLGETEHFAYVETARGAGYRLVEGQREGKYIAKTGGSSKSKRLNKIELIEDVRVKSDK